MKNLRKIAKLVLPMVILAQPVFSAGMLVSQTGLQDLDGSSEKILLLKAAERGISFAMVRVYDSERAFRNGQRQSRQVKISPSQVRLKPGDEAEISLTYLGGNPPAAGKCFTLVADEAPPPPNRGNTNSNEITSGISLAIRHVMKLCYG